MPALGDFSPDQIETLRQHMLREPHMMLDWKMRDRHKFVVSPAVERDRKLSYPWPEMVATEDEVPGKFAEQRARFPDLVIYYWPPRLHRWWITDLDRARLPIAGERDIDRAARDALTDCNFGSWLLRSQTNVADLDRLLDLYDSCRECPSQASLLEMDEVVARGCICGEFLNWEDQTDHESWIDDHDRRHGEDCDCGEAGPFAKRAINDLMGAADNDETTDAYLDRRAEWLAWRIGEAIGRSINRADLAHVCTRWIEPLTPPETSGVYCIQGAGEFVKIGKAKNIAQRIKDIQTNHPVPLQLLAVLSENPGDEGSFHKRYAQLRAHGEWFKLAPELRGALVELRRGGKP